MNVTTIIIIIIIIRTTLIRDHRRGGALLHVGSRPGAAGAERDEVFPRGAHGLLFICLNYVFRI